MVTSSEAYFISLTLKNDIIFLHVLKFAINDHPFIVWSVDLAAGSGRWGYSLDAFTGKILKKIDTLIIGLIG